MSYKFREGYSYIEKPDFVHRMYINFSSFEMIALIRE